MAKKAAAVVIVSILHLAITFSLVAFNVIHPLWGILVTSMVISLILGMIEIRATIRDFSPVPRYPSPWIFGVPPVRETHERIDIIRASKVAFMALHNFLREKETLLLELLSIAAFLLLGYGMIYDDMFWVSVSIVLLVSFMLTSSFWISRHHFQEDITHVSLLFTVLYVGILIGFGSIFIVNFTAEGDVVHLVLSLIMVVLGIVQTATTMGVRKMLEKETDSLLDELEQEEHSLPRILPQAAIFLFNVQTFLQGNIHGITLYMLFTLSATPYLRVCIILGIFSFLPYAFQFIEYQSELKEHASIKDGICYGVMEIFEKTASWYFGGMFMSIIPVILNITGFSQSIDAGGVFGMFMMYACFGVIASSMASGVTVVVAKNVIRKISRIFIVVQNISGILISLEQTSMAQAETAVEHVDSISRDLTELLAIAPVVSRELSNKIAKVGTMVAELGLRTSIEIGSVAREMLGTLNGILSSAIELYFRIEKRLKRSTFIASAVSTGVYSVLGIGAIGLMGDIGVVGWFLLVGFSGMLVRTLYYTLSAVFMVEIFYIELSSRIEDHFRLLYSVEYIVMMLVAVAPFLWEGAFLSLVNMAYLVISTGVFLVLVNILRIISLEMVREKFQDTGVIVLKNTVKESSEVTDSQKRM